MSPFLRCFPLPGSVEPDALYGALCTILPPQYAVGRGCCADTLRFALEAGAQAEIWFLPSSAGVAACAVCYRARGAVASMPEQAEAYLDLFTELIQVIGGRLVTEAGGDTQ